MTSCDLVIPDDVIHTTNSVRSKSAVPFIQKYSIIGAGIENISFLYDIMRAILISGYQMTCESSIDRFFQSRTIAPFDTPRIIF